YYSVEASRDGCIGRCHTGVGVSAVVDGNDLDVAAEDTPVSVALLSGESRTVEHSLAQGGEVAGEGCLQADLPRFCRLLVGTASRSQRNSPSNRKRPGSCYEPSSLHLVVHPSTRRCRPIPLRTCVSIVSAPLSARKSAPPAGGNPRDLAWVSANDWLL